MKQIKNNSLSCFWGLFKAYLLLKLYYCKFTDKHFRWYNFYGALKNKSELNLGAAELLHQNTYYSSVVHCAYYSCIQLMKHTWLNAMGRSENDLRNLNNISSQGSHEVLINQIKIFIQSKSQNGRVFNRDILQLKRLRVIADYEEILIDFKKSNESILLSKSALNILKNVYEQFRSYKFN